jgi:hypothetical protein
MSSIDVPLRNGHFGRTSRRDLWWVEPLLTFVGLSSSFTLAGLPSRATIIATGPICLRFTLPKFWAMPPTLGLVRGLNGGHHGRRCRPLC